jgi:hypothetical protein
MIALSAQIANNAESRYTLDREREHAAVLVCDALNHGIPPAEVLLALIRAQRNHERRERDHDRADLIRCTVFVPQIDVLLDPHESQPTRENPPMPTPHHRKQCAGLLVEKTRIGATL